jgi:membrane protein
MNGTETEHNLENAGRHVTSGEKLIGMWQKICAWVWRLEKPGENFGLNLVRGILRIIFIVVRESQDDRITLRASALTFTVVLSLVPMLALGTAVLKGLGAGDQMRQAAYGFIEQFEPEEPETIITPDTNSQQRKQLAEPAAPVLPDTQEKQGSEASVPAGVTSHLRRAVDQIFDYVDRTDFTTLGTFGIIGMVLAALGVLGSIEQSMNAVWQTTTGRALGRKIIDYMSLMILLPISINLALAATAALQSPALHSQIQNILPVLWLERFFFKALPVAMLVLTFTLLYQFLPNTRVRFLPALAGGVFGGLTWFWVQIVYVKLQIGVARYNAIYGSFATLPLFFLWIYVAWVVFLLGAEVAFAFQARRNYQWGANTITPAARLAIAFDIMEAAMEDYRARRISDRISLAQSFNQTEKTINVIVNDLINGGLLRRVEGKLEGYVPACPLDELKPSEIMDVILGKDLPDVKGCDLAEQALAAARSTLDRYNLNCREINNPAPPETEESHRGTS